MSNTYITEAFKKFDLLESEDFTLDASGLNDLDSFLATAAVDPDDEIIEIVDLEAEAKDDLKQSYMGKIIAKCDICQSDLFIDPEDIEHDEETDEPIIHLECPYCMSTDEFTIIGQVAPLGCECADCEEADDEIEIEIDTDNDGEEDIEIEIPAEEAEVDVDDVIEDAEEAEDEEITEALEQPKHIQRMQGKACEECDEACECEDEPVEEGILGTGLGAVAGGLLGGPVGAVAGGLIGHTLTDSLEVEEPECEDCEACDEGIIDTAKKAIKVGAGAALDSIKDDILDEAEEVEIVEEPVDAEVIDEAIEAAVIETEDETMSMESTDEGGVVIETTPKADIEDACEECDGVIAPVDDTIVTEIVDAVEEPEAEIEEIEEEPEAEEEIIDEFPAEDFDEEAFDELGEAYLKRCYENVNSFKTSAVAIKNDQLIIEGIINFTSGNDKATQFIFEKKDNTDNKLKLEGFNKNISNGKKTFKLTCRVNENKLTAEALNYNYKSKNELNESVRVYGTVRKVK